MARKYFFFFILYMPWFITVHFSNVLSVVSFLFFSLYERHIASGVTAPPKKEKEKTMKKSRKKTSVK